jgi:N6-L-threonylcarbamoyladenine synthase
MLLLGIETSCDETSLALMQGKEDLNSKTFLQKINQVKVLNSLISSQIKTHRRYGGVVPEISAREHSKQIHYLFKKLLSEKTDNELHNISNLELTKSELETVCRIEKIFVTSEPGLLSSLKVGIEFSKTLCFFLEDKFQKTVPVKKVNHLHGHLLSCFYHPREKNNLLDEEIFPHLHLLVSGGNTQLILLNNPQEFRIIGQTLDDSAGETFDKIGRMLGIPYPGGVYISKISGLNQENFYNLPVGMSKNRRLDFSYSGLKTAVRYFIQKQKIEDLSFEKKLNRLELSTLLSNDTKRISKSPKLDFIYRTCVSSQTVIIEQLISKIKLAKIEHSPNSIGISGGVSANELLRKRLNEEFSEKKFLTEKNLTGDNAVMIILAGIQKITESEAI